ncbi:helix-turn-helix domain-containing protein [Clostridium chromiireducens]|uniref:Helix-turn-helix domain-containing protein n=1 Tax=Clostridium chromiireducens TaxID=225345 RepID=A0A964RIC2_9CLOT|nr:helix-turn-helix domain-containing protein [Clostridium chromiireducens]MVX62269.1 helix-turn-helix domain-containing protein [Clostridium chromiireducens]
MLGDRIKMLREEKKITQANLADFLNISPSTIGMWEQNRRSPDNESLKRLSDFFEVSIDYLLGKNDIRNYETIDKNLDIKIDIPKDYSDKYKVTSRDKKQYLEEMKKANEAFFMNDEFDEEAKKDMLDLMAELFWDAKAKNKRKK